MSFVFEYLSLKGKTAIVTGAGQGIGKAIALGLAELGAKVAVADMNNETGPRTQQEITEMGEEAIFIQADLRQIDEINRLVDKITALWSHVNILVNNAGGTFFAPAIHISPNGFDAVIRENLSTTWHCSVAVAKTMIAAGHGGAIINLTSVSGILGAYDHAHYGAAKAGIIGLTKALATEWGVEGIRVNAIAPGGIDTEGNRGLSSTSDYNHVPLPRKGTPEDVAGAVVFLASDLAAYVTGQTLLVDGGMTIRPSSQTR